MSEARTPKIGAPMTRINGYAKASGAQIYPSDYVLDGMLWLKVLRSPYPHARIISIITSEAEKVEGVVSIVTVKDIKGSNRVGPVIQDRPVLCTEKICYLGDALAIVAAESDAAARIARDIITVEYEALPIVDDVHTAMQPDSPRVHENNNVLFELHLGHGDIESAFASADTIIEDKYRTSRQEHTFLETEAGVAFYGEDGRLNVRAGGQYPQRDRSQIADALGIDEDNIHVITPMTGGAFGGKDDISVQCYLALVTLLTKRPCRLMLDRRESFLAGTKRHPFHMRYKTACTKEGRLLGAQVELISDTGAYASYGREVLGFSAEHCLGPYYFPATRIDAYCVYTNNCPSGAFRGFGGPQVVIGIEQQMDRMARSICMDPMAFRRKNTLKAGQKAAIGNVLDQTSNLEKVFDAVKQGSLYRQREICTHVDPDAERWKKRGIGMAVAWQGFGLGAGIPDYATARVELTESGHYRLWVGGTDMGQGNATALVQIAAHELSCHKKDIELVLGDTDGPDSGPCVASRTIFIVGKATIRATNNLREQILTKVADRLNCKSGDLRLASQAIIVRDDRRRVPLREIGPLSAEGSFNMPWAEKIYPGLPHKLFTYCAQVALVEVDLLTGQVEVLKMHNVIDVGRAINRQGVEAQSEGGIVQGLGFALYEDVKTEGGQILNPNLSTYIIPTIYDMPKEVETTIIEDPEPLGPYGAKGIAEAVMSPTAAAILNAVYDATGIRFTQVPLTSEQILRGLIGED